MKRIHAQFYQERNGALTEALGTDGRTLPMDGRWNLESCHRYARQYAERMEAIRSDYVGYRLFAGQNYTDRVCVSGFCRTGVEK